MTTSDDKTSASDHLWALMQEMRVAMLGSRGPGGALRSRPLTAQNDGIDRNGVLHFFVAADSDVVADVLADASVNVAFSDSGRDSYVSISGEAQVVHDLARQATLWTSSAERWFPRGPEDPQLRLLEVRIGAAEYWDTTQSRMLQFFDRAQAAVTGASPPPTGEHHEVSLR